MFREMKVDILKDINSFDGVCITTNGIVRSNGRLVMGAGVAKLFRDNFTNLDLKAGLLVKEYGNNCMLLEKYGGTKIFTFPTKLDYRDNSCIIRIKYSCVQLMNLIDLHNLVNVALPRPGCNNGGLNWDHVKEEIKELLDSRVVIVYK